MTAGDDDGPGKASKMSTRAERIQEKAFERRWLILVALCFSLLVIVLDNSILNVALVTIQEDLGATASDLQWIVDLSLIHI